jgi:hypothetical protein
MKAARGLALLFAASFLLSLCRADAGEDGFLFLNTPLSARGAGLGGAMTAVADEAAAAAWNPAAWGELRRGEAFLANARQGDGVTLNGAALAFPLSKGALGLDLRAQGYGDIQGYDAGGARTGSIDARDTLIGVAYGRPWRGSWTFGVGVEQVEEKLADVSGRSLAVNAGALWRPFPTGWRQGFRFGASLMHLGSGASMESSKTPLPRTISAGAAYQTFTDGWLTAVTLEKSGHDTISWRAGQEIKLGGGMVLRAGYATSDGFSDGYSVGAGFHMKDIRIDYALSGQGRGYEDAHRLSLSWRFGGASEKIYDEGAELLRAGRPGEAILKFNEVLEVEPGHREAVARLREAAGVLKRRPGGAHGKE